MGNKCVKLSNTENDEKAKQHLKIVGKKTKTTAGNGEASGKRNQELNESNCDDKLNTAKNSLNNLGKSDSANRSYHGVHNFISTNLMQLVSQNLKTIGFEHRNIPINNYFLKSDNKKELTHQYSSYYHKKFCEFCINGFGGSNSPFFCVSSAHNLINISTFNPNSCKGHFLCAGRTGGFTDGVKRLGETFDIYLINYETGHIIKIWQPAHTGRITVMTKPFSPPCLYKHFLAYTENNFNFNSVHDMESVARRKVVQEVVDMTPGSGLFYTGSEDGTAKAWRYDPLNTDFVDNNAAMTFNLAGATSLNIDVHPLTGDKLITGTTDRAIKLWDVNSGSMITSTYTLSEPCFAKFIPSLNAIAYADKGSTTIKIWDTRSRGMSTASITLCNDPALGPSGENNSTTNTCFIASADVALPTPFDHNGLYGYLRNQSGGTKADDYSWNELGHNEGMSEEGSFDNYLFSGYVSDTRCGNTVFCEWDLRKRQPSNHYILEGPGGASATAMHVLRSQAFTTITVDADAENTNSKFCSIRGGLLGATSDGKMYIWGKTFSKNTVNSRSSSCTPLASFKVPEGNIMSFDETPDGKILAALDTGIIMVLTPGAETNIGGHKPPALLRYRYVGLADQQS